MAKYCCPFSETFRSLTGVQARTLKGLLCLLLICGQLVGATFERRHQQARHLQNQSSSATDYGCTDANRYIYNALTSSNTWHINQRQMLSKAVAGEHLKVCAQGFTCCTSEMETELASQSKRDYQRVVEDKIIGLRHTFESRTSRFDRFFRELLQNSRKGLHEMFLSTYGMFYEQHSDVFTTLFHDLTAYYVSGRVDLDAVMQQFYQNLYQRMFQILNRPYEFEDNYWDCVTKHMDRLKPFGDVPAKMSQQIRRSFVAARTFVQALVVGKEIIHKVSQLPPSTQCSGALMRMLYCPHCRGLTDAKPCANFCLNVMKGCLAHQSNLDSEWNQYIDALLKLLERLEGPFNIETAIDPIDVKISEAIMIFQENGPEISSKVFSGCGHPRIVGGREKRAPDPIPQVTRSIDSVLPAGATSPANGASPPPAAGKSGANTPASGRAPNAGSRRLEDVKFGRNAEEGSLPKPTTAAGTSLDRLTRDMREKIQMAKGFWTNLPYSLCNDESVAASAKEDKDCWNGIAKDRYQVALSGDGFNSQLENPEVPVEANQPNSNITEQIMRLRMVTAKLEKAYSGQDVDWTAANPAGGSDASDIADDFSRNGPHSASKRKSNGEPPSGTADKAAPATTLAPAAQSRNAAANQHNTVNNNNNANNAVLVTPSHATAPAMPAGRFADGDSALDEGSGDEPPFDDTEPAPRRGGGDKAGRQQQQPSNQQGEPPRRKNNAKKPANEQPAFAPAISAAQPPRRFPSVTDDEDLEWGSGSGDGEVAEGGVELPKSPPDDGDLSSGEQRQHKPAYFPASSTAWPPRGYQPVTPPSYRIDSSTDTVDPKANNGQKKKTSGATRTSVGKLYLVLFVIAAWMLNRGWIF